jgi:hypothetical protein
MMDDRRSAPRGDGPLEAQWAGRTSSGRGRVRDLSAAGCYLESVMMPGEGELLQLSIVGPTGRPMKLLAEVVEYRERNGFAVRFLDLTAPQERELLDMVTRLRPKLP